MINALYINFILSFTRKYKECVNYLLKPVHIIFILTPWAFGHWPIPALRQFHDLHIKNIFSAVAILGYLKMKTHCLVGDTDQIYVGNLIFRASAIVTGTKDLQHNLPSFTIWHLSHPGLNQLHRMQTKATARYTTVPTIIYNQFTSIFPSLTIINLDILDIGEVKYVYEN